MAAGGIETTVISREILTARCHGKGPQRCCSHAGVTRDGGHRRGDGDGGQVGAAKVGIHVDGQQALGQISRGEGTTGKGCSNDFLELAVAGDRREVGTHAECLVAHKLDILEVDAGERIVLQRATVELDHRAGQVHAGEVATAKAHHADFLHAFGQGEAGKVETVEEHMSAQPLHSPGQGDAAHLAVAEAAVTDLTVGIGDVHPSD